MPSIRSVRHSLGLTLVELALTTGIPARTLCQIEHGLLPLDPDRRVRLAEIFGFPPELLCAGDTYTRDTRAAPGLRAGPRRLVGALIVSLAGALLLAPPFLDDQPRSVAASDISLAIPSGARLAAQLMELSPVPTTLPAASPSPEFLQAVSQLNDSARIEIPPSVTPAPPTETALPTETPTETPTPAFRLEADGPHGCPLAAASGRIVITQGYDVGTHSPAAIWGGIDLAIDADGDGGADPGAVSGVTIVATHGGTARVFLGSWPGGNYVRVEDGETGWKTAYAHLASVAVADGQALADGTPIGTVGATGYASGPHLHYEVWHDGQNIDPTTLITCAPAQG